MKIKLKDLSPNPYKKHINGGKLNKDKVALLKESIEKDGFWDNVICRKNNGTYEIAYGHHRLEAAKQVLGKDYEVDIPVKQLTDENMVRILSNENSQQNEEYAIYQVDTVLLAKKYLEENPQLSTRWTAGHGAQSDSARGISIFLGEKNWSKSKVAELLRIQQRLDPSILAEMKNAPNIGNKHKGLSVRHATEIAKIPDKKKQREVAGRAKKEKWSSDKTHEEVKSITNPLSKLPKRDPSFEEMIKRLTQNYEIQELVMGCDDLEKTLKRNPLCRQGIKVQAVMKAVENKLLNTLKGHVKGVLIDVQNNKNDECIEKKPLAITRVSR